MRIGMILDKTFPPDPRVENEAVVLTNAGHEVFLFCFTYSDETGIEKHKGFNVVRYKSNMFIHKISALAYELPFYSILLKPKIEHFLSKFQIEAIHVHDMRIAGSVFQINKELQLPIILDLHDNYPEVMKEYPHLKKFPGKYIISPKLWLKNEQKFIEKATKVISVSKEFVSLIKDRLTDNKDKVILVPNTVNQSFFAKAFIDKDIIKRFDDKFTLLYIGDTGLRRGLLTAIQALPYILEQIPNCQLLIVGKSTTDTVLKQAACNLNVENAVIFEGWQDEKLLATYILASKIGISPLYRSKQHDIAYANKLFQYMSLGLPVLVSNATAQKNLIEETASGLVHIEKNAKDFAEKTLMLYNNEKLYTSCSDNAKDFIRKKFYWEITAKNLVHLYNNLDR